MGKDRGYNPESLNSYKSLVGYKLHFAGHVEDLYVWGGVIYDLKGPRLECQDISKEDMRGKSTAVKEAMVLVNTIQAGKSLLTNCRVDARVDNLTFIQAWNKQGGKSKPLNDILKAQNIPLSLQFALSAINQGDSLSHVLLDKDCTLARKPWKKV